LKAKRVRNEVTPSSFVTNLNSILKVRQELAKVYREARQGKIKTNDLTRYAYVLNILCSMIRDSELEEKVRHLEETLEVRSE